MIETINLPNEEIVTLIKDCPPLSKAHDWRKRLRSILDEMLDVLDNNEDFGYFDSIIDVQTDALLIDRAMKKYIEEHNKRWAKSEGIPHEVNQSLLTTKEFIDKQNKGGYSAKYQERLERLLT